MELSKNTKNLLLIGIFFFTIFNIVLTFYILRKKSCKGVDKTCLSRTELCDLDKQVYNAYRQGKISLSEKDGKALSYWITDYCN